MSHEREATRTSGLAPLCTKMGSVYVPNVGSIAPKIYEHLSLMAGRGSRPLHRLFTHRK